MEKIRSNTQDFLFCYLLSSGMLEANLLVFIFSLKILLHLRITEHCMGRESDLNQRKVTGMLQEGHLGCQEDTAVFFTCPLVIHPDNLRDISSPRCPPYPSVAINHNSSSGRRTSDVFVHSWAAAVCSPEHWCENWWPLNRASPNCADGGEDTGLILLPVGRITTAGSKGTQPIGWPFSCYSSVCQWRWAVILKPAHYK